MSGEPPHPSLKYTFACMCLCIYAVLVNPSHFWNPCDFEYFCSPCHPESLLKSLWLRVFLQYLSPRVSFKIILTSSSLTKIHVTSLAFQLNIKSLWPRVAFKIDVQCTQKNKWHPQGYTPIWRFDEKYVFWRPYTSLRIFARILLRIAILKKSVKLITKNT